MNSEIVFDSNKRIYRGLTMDYYYELGDVKVK